MEKRDIHNFERQLKGLTEKIKKEKRISEKNKKLIIKFMKHCFAEGLSIPRIATYLQILKSLAIQLRKDFDKATKKDIMRLVERIEREGYRIKVNGKTIRKKYSEWAKHDRKVTLKKFYRWLKGTDVYPEEVRWIKTTSKAGTKILPEEILSEEEIKKMIEVAEHPRDKAFIAVLYESGCRIGEMVNIKIKNVIFDKYGAQLIVNGKTGMRRIRLISSVPLLARWIELHPQKNDKEAFLWTGIGTRNKNREITYEAIRAFLKKIARKAGLNKRIYPYLFRHSRATFLASKLTEAQMKEFFGWTQSSDMASVYVHLSGREVDKALLRIYGIEKERGEEEIKLKPRKCPRCKSVNDISAKYCQNCGGILDEKEAFEMAKREERFFEFMRMVEEMVKEEKELKRILGKSKKFSIILRS